MCRFSVSFGFNFLILRINFSYSNDSINKVIIDMNKQIDGFLFLISRRVHTDQQ